MFTALFTPTSGGPLEAAGRLRASLSVSYSTRAISVREFPGSTSRTKTGAFSARGMEYAVQLLAATTIAFSKSSAPCEAAAAQDAEIWLAITCSLFIFLLRYNQR